MLMLSTIASEAEERTDEVFVGRCFGKVLETVP